MTVPTLSIAGFVLFFPLLSVAASLILKRAVRGWPSRWRSPCVAGCLDGRSVMDQGSISEWRLVTDQGKSPAFCCAKRNFTAGSPLAIL